jgi:hypothetical protein
MPAGLEKRIGELYDTTDGLYLSGMDDAVKDGIVEEVAADKFYGFWPHGCGP